MSDWEQAYADQERTENARWMSEALPHVVRLAAAFIGQGYAPMAAAKDAVVTYQRIEAELEKALP